MVRIDRVYTRGGDRGETSLVGGERVAKDSVRVEAYGTIDELNADLGLARAALEGSPARARLDPLLAQIQNELFDVGSALATADPERRRQHPIMGEQLAAALERVMDELKAELSPLKSFVLPGGGPVSATLHLARTVCRRAERRVVTLLHAEGGPAGSPDTLEAVRYLNRLSDTLFVMSRFAAKADGREELLWEPGKR